MAVLARSSITLVTSVDIDSVYWFYLLQASTAAAPAKPTTVPATKGNAPSGWSKTEPTTVDINKTLYRVELTYFTDGTGVYSSVNQVSSYEAAKVAYNKANTVQTNLDDAYDKLQSMGEQLVVNGSAFTGDNTNFTEWTFDGAVANGTKGSFTKASDWNGTPMTNESFPIDITKRYRFEFDAKSKNKTARHYSFLNFYDVDGNTIYANHHMFIANTLTTLSQDLKNGDTVVHLADLTNWKTSTGTATHQRGLTFWNYKNSFGYQYPELTYSRNTWANLYTDANVNKTAKTITLSSPWSHGTIPAGTKVSQSNSGANYKYNPWSNSLVETEWTHYVGYYDGTDYSGNNVQTKFPPGAATAKVGFLWNYQKQSTTDQLWITNVSVMEDVKTSISNAQTTANNAATAASNAQATADSKKSMIKINAPAKSFTTANWKTYGAAGHTETWSTGSSYPNPDIKVGDTAYIIGTVTDGARGSASVIGTVTAINGTNGTTSITMTSQQLIFGGDSVFNAWDAAMDADDYADEAYGLAVNSLTMTRYNVSVKAGAAIAANKLLMNVTTTPNTAASYKQVAQNTTYNIESPILFTPSAISSGGTSANCYYIGRAPAWSGMTTNKPVFLKGTLDGNKFTTVNAADYITQTEPTSSDGYHYIYLGTAASATEILLQAEHPIYMFIGGSFHRIGSSSDKIVQKWVGSAAAAAADAKLHGSYIQYKTISAEQIFVEDLYALGATIGGFVIDETSIHSVNDPDVSSWKSLNWVVGSFNTDGSENDDAKRMRSAALPSDADYLKSYSPYVFTILAWENGAWKGYLKTDGTISTGTSNLSYVSNFNARQYMSDYPTYTFRGLLKNNDSPNSNIDYDDVWDNDMVELYAWSPGIQKVRLDNSDFTRTVAGSSRTDWRFAINTNFGVTKSGYLYATAATISGSITASSGKIGGFTISSYSIYSGTGTSSTAAGAVALTNSNFSRSIGGASRPNLRLAIGGNFGVNSSGTVYANNANLLGTVTCSKIVTTATLFDMAENYNDFSVYRYDRMISFSCDGISLGGFDMYMQSWGDAIGDWKIKNGYRPAKTIWAPVVFQPEGGGFKLACMRVQPEGWVDCYMYDTYGGAAQNVKTFLHSENSNPYGIGENSHLFFNFTWATNQDPT